MLLQTSGSSFSPYELKVVGEEGNQKNDRNRNAENVENNRPHKTSGRAEASMMPVSVNSPIGVHFRAWNFPTLAITAACCKAAVVQLLAQEAHRGEKRPILRVISGKIVECSPSQS